MYSCISQSVPSELICTNGEFWFLINVNKFNNCPLFLPAGGEKNAIVTAAFFRIFNT